MRPDPRSEIRIYRHPWIWIGVLAMSVLFIVSIGADWLGFVPLGFTQLPGLSTIFLIFLILVAGWSSVMIWFRRQAVLIIRHSDITLVHAVLPTCQATIPFDQITNITTSWQPDTVPSYLIVHVDNLDPEVDNSGIWEKIEGDKRFYECSNLTQNAPQLASIIASRLTARS
ncbi:hypothetical protein [Bremerella cremea]|uniref:hypothetical protein n=1 Tax=Bremerella cremea TaxID=1031537 RepID=UPI0031EB6656